MERRCAFHLEPEKGWMNDPNGLCFFNGRYHVFYQHNPDSLLWKAPLRWGHAVSDDLVSFTHNNTALLPDMPYENDGGCFSGSAIEKGGRLYLFYTSVSKELGQTQSVAYSDDGITFDKYEGNPIIPKSPLGDNTDFRDPKVFEYNGHYYMVCGAAIGNCGKVLLFRSDNLFDWEFVNSIYENTHSSGVSECPEMFYLDGRWVLMFSAVERKSPCVLFVIGDFDGERFINCKESFCEYGTDFYAPQTFLDNRGRRIMIGWLYNDDRPNAADSSSASSGVLSIPRELHIRNDRITNYPVEEAHRFFDTDCECADIIGSIISIDCGDSGEYRFDLSCISGFRGIEKLDLLCDKKLVEIFINGGEISLSRLLC